MLREGKIETLLLEAHEAQAVRVAKQTEAHSKSTSNSSFSKTARAAIMAGFGAMGRACKLAFSYCLESDPAIAAKFLSKLTLKKKHAHIPDFVARVKSAGNSIHLKQGSNGRLLWNAEEVSSPPAWLDVGAHAGRCPNPFDSGTAEEVRITLLIQWSIGARPMGLPGLCHDVSLPQEAT